MEGRSPLDESSSTEGSANDGPGDHLASGRVSTLEAPEADLDGSFYALAQFLESSIVNRLKPACSSEGVFPTEIYQEILRHVNIDTQRACLAVSQNMRQVCRESLFVCEGLQLHGFANEHFEFWDVLEHESLQLKLIREGEDHDLFRGFMDEYYPYFITCGYGLLSSSLVGPDASRVSRNTLSMIGKCALGGYREHDIFPEDLPDLQNKVSRLIRSGPVRPDQFWESFPVQLHFKGQAHFSSPQLDYGHSCPVISLQNAWKQIFSVYSIHNVLDNAVVRLRGPPFYRILKLCVYGQSLTQGTVLEIHIGRPNGWRNLNETFVFMRERAHERISNLLQKVPQTWTSTFVLIAVDTALEIYQFDSSRQLIPYDTEEPKRLQIFDEAQREEVEGLLKHVRKLLPDIEKNLQPHPDGGRASHDFDYN